MPTISRLATIAPDLDESLRSLPSDRQTLIAMAAARWAVERALPSEPQVVGWLVSGGRIELDQLARELDDRYLELAESFDGKANAEVAEAFSKARAVSAAAFAVGGEAQEAVYEAAQSTHHLHDFRQFVLASAHAV